MDDDISKFDHSFENFSLDDDHCFLCGNHIGRDVTQEDVFPRWLQRKHKLWNKKLSLINNTNIRYSQLKIPCCSKCNNEHLSKLENKISSVIKHGYRSCIKMDPILFFLWGAKIIYGIVRKELSLLSDRSNPEKDSILPKKFVETYNNLHIFMQGIRRSMEFIGPLPFSVLIANLHDLGDERNYYFRDSVVCQTLSIRSGEVGIIIACADAGINNHTYSKYLQEVDGRKIHPIQFDELFARVTYQSHLLVKNPYFTVSANKDRSKPIQVVTHLPRANMLKDWDQKKFAYYLEIVMEKWKIPLNSFFVPPDGVHTLLTNDNGTLRFINENDE